MADQPQNDDEPITWQPTERAQSGYDAHNPYAPTAMVEPAAEILGPEETRRKYLSHEVSVQPELFTKSGEKERAIA